MSSITTSTEVKAPALSKRAEKLLTVMLAILSPLFLIGFLEGAAYFWERKQANSLYAWELVASRRMVWIQFDEPGAGYTLMEPNRHYEWQSIPVEINSQGLRGPETAYEKPSSTIRILNLGDSIVMGWGVREESTYGRQLETLLNDDEGDDLHYEVINAGVPGWSLDNALAYLQAEGLKYEPDLIVLDLTIANDINGKSALLAGSDPAPLRWLSDHTYFWPFLQSQVAWAKARAEGRDRVDTIDPPTNPAKYFPLDPKSERWTERWNTILQINRLARENNIPMVLVMFPLEFQVIDESYSTLPQDLFAARAKEAGIPTVDLLPAFQRACLKKPGGACQLEDRFLFADVWMHPSAEGNRLVAVELDKFLTQIIER